MFKRKHIDSLGFLPPKGAIRFKRGARLKFSDCSGAVLFASAPYKNAFSASRCHHLQRLPLIFPSAPTQATPKSCSGTDEDTIGEQTIRWVRGRHRGDFALQCRRFALDLALIDFAAELDCYPPSPSRRQPSVIRPRLSSSCPSSEGAGGRRYADVAIIGGA
uniref:Uncharacterized protein n=1 Tax=Trichuris muris TaxID=70415 RepID=A0A5S6QY38_TRIMR